MNVIKICTFNTRGIRNRHKRWKYFTFFHNHSYDIIFLQESHSTPRDENYWKNEWGGKCFFSHGSNDSRGCMILIKPSLNICIEDSVCDMNGRFIIVKCYIEDLYFFLVNVYAPNLDQPSFFANLEYIINEKCTDKYDIVWGGDFNLVFNFDLDKKGGNKITNFNARNRVFNIIEKYDLVDIWRERNPSTPKYTWHSTIDKSIHCRLDFFLLSMCLSHLIDEALCTPLFNSDHDLVTVSIHSSLKRGPGTWKFNSSLLKDNAYVQLVRQTITSICKEHSHLNDTLLWEFIKCEIRNITMSFSKRKAKERLALERNLLRCISFYDHLCINNPSDHNTSILKGYKDDLDLLYQHKLDGIFIRSRARWVEEGEKNSKYFLNLERRNKSVNCITKLKKDDESVITENVDILKSIESFYRSLYSRRTLDSPRLLLTSLGNDKRVPDITKESMEGTLSVYECKNALFSMPSNKSPGCDGLTSEFYKYFWNDIENIVVNALNFAYFNECLSNTQSRAIISLISKPGKDKLYLKNWRPIALLNLDYKIAAKALANRVKPALIDLISTNQTGFIKGRYIGENIRLVLDTIEYCKNNDIGGSLIFLDFEKAFDSLDHIFINNVLTHFNFGSSFRQWVSTLYNNALSCVSNNGYFTDYFPVARGVRQGCPLSPYLFIICSEVLCMYVKQDYLFRGITINGCELKISQYADDTVLFTDGAKSSIDAVTSMLNKFASISGLVINFSKSYIFPLGPYTEEPPNYLTNCIYNISKGPIQYLGISFTHHHDDFFRLNYLPKLSRLKSILNLWSMRDLTPIGKIVIMKTFAISQLVYLFTVLPNPPKTYIAELNTLLFNFIWNGKPHKVKTSSLIND